MARHIITHTSRSFCLGEISVFTFFRALSHNKSERLTNSEIKSARPLLLPFTKEKHNVKVA